MTNNPAIEQALRNLERAPMYGVLIGLALLLISIPLKIWIERWFAKRRKKPKQNWRRRF
jgi:hypothetical protein